MKIKRIFNVNFIIILSFILISGLTDSPILTIGYSQGINNNIMVTELGGNSVIKLSVNRTFNLLIDYFNHSIIQLRGIFNKPLQMLIEALRGTYKKNSELCKKDSYRKSNLVNEPETELAQKEIISAITDESRQGEEIGGGYSSPETEDQTPENNKNNISKSFYRETSNDSNPSDSPNPPANAYVFNVGTGSSPGNLTENGHETPSYSSNDNLSDSFSTTDSSSNSSENSNKGMEMEIDNVFLTFVGVDESENEESPKDSPPSEENTLLSEGPIPASCPPEPFLITVKRLPTGIENEIEVVILARNDSDQDTLPIGIKTVIVKNSISSDGRNWENGEIAPSRKDLLSRADEYDEDFYINIKPELLNVSSYSEVELGSIIFSGIDGSYYDYRVEIIVEDGYGTSFGSADFGVDINRLGSSS